MYKEARDNSTAAKGKGEKQTATEAQKLQRAADAGLLGPSVEVLNKQNVIGLGAYN
jgi:hypothetical protein